ncbi:MAG: DUF1566 domain-containing protein [Deltaproteobacteria bacterium]|nr:DUF1566 domain-containing protein [Deltaproteobacteria bacterium]
MNTCATLGATSCQGGRLRACVADGGGCLSWGAESVCADGFCASTSACGVCNSDCAAVGTTSCQSGQLQTCLADSNGCLRWNVPTRCASGSCEDATSCSCTAETDIVFCSRLGRSCGSVTDVDNCGSPRTVSCGLCAEGTCNLSGVCVAADYEWTRWRVPPDAPPASNYQISGGVVTDAVTGLQWQRSISTEEYLWEDAKSYCAGSWLDGGGWRLPTVVELQSIVDFGRYDPAIDPMAFPNTPPDSFWTSSVLVGHFNDAWVVYFAYGTVAYDNGLLDDNWVRCVR